MSKQQFNFNTWVFLVLNGLGIACLAYYFFGGMPIFNTQIASELIPVQGVIDQNSLGQLSSTLFLIRQHYVFFPVELSTVPFLLFSIFSLIGITYLITSFKKSSNISWLFTLSGILLWLAIISIKNAEQPIETIYEVLFSQLIWLGIISLFLITILFSNTICLFLLQLGHSSTKKESQKNQAKNNHFNHGCSFRIHCGCGSPGLVGTLSVWSGSVCSVSAGNKSSNHDLSLSKTSCPQPE